MMKQVEKLGCFVTYSEPVTRVYIKKRNYRFKGKHYDTAIFNGPKQEPEYTSFKDFLEATKGMETAVGWDGTWPDEDFDRIELHGFSKREFKEIVKANPNLNICRFTKSMVAKSLIGIILELPFGYLEDILNEEQIECFERRFSPIIEPLLMPIFKWSITCKEANVREE